MSALDRLAAPFAHARSGDSDLPTGLVLLSGAIAAAVLSPIAWILLRVFEAEGDVSLVTQPSTFATSIALVAVVTGASVVIGVPLAFLTVRTDLPFRRFWTIAVALPLVIPSYLGAFTYISAFGPSGYIAGVLAPLGIDSVPSVYGFGGVALVLTLYTFPYVFITTRASLLSFDESLVEAARTLGVSRLEAFRRVTLPQLVPGIASGALLVALYALSDFGTPNLLRLEVLTQAIWVDFNGFGRETAAMLSLQLLTITAVILAVQSRVGDSTQGAYVGTRASTSSDTTVALGRWKAPALAFCATVVTMCLVVPLAVLFVWFRRGASDVGRTRLVFEWSYATNSVLVSVAAAVVCALAAIPVAYLAARHRSTIAEVIDRATYIGYAMPGIVLGLALVFFGVSYGAAVDDLSSVVGIASYLPALYQTLPLLIFAYVVRFLPQSVGATRSSVMRVDRELTEAARLLGQSSLGAFRRVALPLIAPGVLAGAALVFLTTMKELPATLLLQPTGFDTLVTYIWAVRESGSYGAAAIPAFVLIVVSALSMVVILSQEK
ncbi:ABC transporter permease [Halarchaeum nitratireducens]|uniref:Iron ABC transporter permease n=1 Tax=Halarchaeum nitratireducens TaxID=489913 RepID=A0A830G831_9EURY|nr:iron ABC transporter permease [Halarchaeum nitratireducens]GGN09894.1 iron ABC transporter permease [Halarchaeum nitratireducens]